MNILRWIEKHFEEVILTVLLIAISCILLAQVIARYVFQDALSWSDELSRYMLVWAGFLSVSYCVRNGISIKIEQVQNALPSKLVPFFRLARHTLVFAFCILMLPYSVTYVNQAIASGATSAAMQIPMYYIQCAPLVCFILLAIRVAQAWVKTLKIIMSGKEA